ncbi:NADH dehydrogenase (ubiquinone) 1 alpha/beta subcomplex 1 [Strigomonas culicis]|uniref:Acyl carrier protein n=1 Tax=Strigomonas culicis TaxID=28005 RepID=S9U8U9_9TRYP|nr:NADH dehydrogenase (ubiquinone) 1 alpha/beta subcomplex 1 [Strigomonas culicis]|eukprot:EPY25189.1 NADH dehydrogenase (ubiquinone) 1 alpha/beta subcomplex 1 [Strigomonas culicis]
MQRTLVARSIVRRITVGGLFVSLPAARLAMNTVSAKPMVSLPVSASFSRFYSGGGHDEEPAARSGHYLLDRNDVLTRVLEVVKNFEKVDASKVTPESHFVNDLGLNSLDVVEVVFAIEQEFILDIPDHDAEKIQSIPDAVEYIAQNPMAK